MLLNWNKEVPNNRFVIFNFIFNINYIFCISFNVKNEVKEKPADDDEKKNEEEIVSKEESIEDISSDSIEEDSKDE